MSQNDYSDYVVYVDESGDHGLKTIDESYPVFVLAFCIFKKQDYVEKVVPKLQDFKFRILVMIKQSFMKLTYEEIEGSFLFLKQEKQKIPF